MEFRKNDDVNLKVCDVFRTRKHRPCEFAMSGSLHMLATINGRSDEASA